MFIIQCLQIHVHCNSKDFYLYASITGADLGEILTDFLNERQRHKLLAGSGRRLPQEKKLDFYYLKSPFLGFQVIQTECWPDGNLESVFIIKNIQEKLSSLETY